MKRSAQQGQDFRIATAVLIAGVCVWATPSVTVLAAPTLCDSGFPNVQSSDYFSWAQQWVSNTSHFFHPGTGCPGDDSNYGWVGIDGDITTPPHFPNLAGADHNHSLGWFNVEFSDFGWVQVGWLGGCVGNNNTVLCSTPASGLKVYDESMNSVTHAYILGLVDGTVGYNTVDIYRIEYYPDSQCWDVFKGYSTLLRSLCGTFPNSGNLAAGSEVWNGNTTGTPVEMPIAYYGSANPNTNDGLRIKGGAGYVPWSTSLSTGSTTDYDERNCPNSSYCPSPSPAYTISGLHNNYNFEAYGATS